MFNNQLMSSFDKYFYENIAVKIRFYREKEGITQEQLSDFLGKNLKYIGHIERCERRISMKVLSQLLKHWKLQPSEFFAFNNKYNFESK